jgi:hypothetical protein
VSIQKRKKKEKGKGGRGETHDVLVPGAGVELRDKGLEDEDAREDGEEDAGEEEDDGEAGKDAQLVLPPGEAVDVARAPPLDAEGTAGAEAQGELALAHAPPLDEHDGPEDDEDGVDRRVRRAEEVEEDAEDGGEDEGLRVRVQEGEVHRD